MSIVYAYCILALALAGLIALVRMERGPSMLDRIVALDVITAVVLGAVTLVSAGSRRTDLVPVLVVLATVGFVGSVAMARFVAVERAEESRILTKDELRELLAQQKVIDDDAAPVHDPDAAASAARGEEPEPGEYAIESANDAAGSDLGDGRASGTEGETR
ncbi:monovalent cation/H+ antiporter complex subunit F [Georgenia sp. SYP-B2076]|uniref:monovalent cation/H+ antiporter complex subunit F n=1 Tax=Georgenia sp. SYP-B2076 TaxID=2495881 RepID=UPI000F8C6EB2|nr:MrpF/PhaF family protein [Georgenia sp. SYP-B2076]